MSAFDAPRRSADHFILALPAKQLVSRDGSRRRCRECPNEVVSGASVDPRGRQCHRTWPQLYSVASETPCLRARSAVFAPASCSRSTPIICSSVNLARFICPSVRRPDSNSTWRNFAGAGQAETNLRASLRCLRLDVVLLSGAAADRKIGPTFLSSVSPSGLSEDDVPTDSAVDFERIPLHPVVAQEAIRPNFPDCRPAHLEGRVVRLGAHEAVVARQNVNLAKFPLNLLYTLGAARIVIAVVPARYSGPAIFSWHDRNGNCGCAVAKRLQLSIKIQTRSPFEILFFAMPNLRAGSLPP
jgi:hypothetical protein